VTKNKKALSAAAMTAVTLGLGGCALQPPPVAEISIPFDQTAYRQYTTPGDNGIKGQAFLRQRGGGVVTCAGEGVLLFPDTTFFQLLINEARAGKQINAQTFDDPRYKYMMRKGQCDAQGNFSFAGLPAGEWLLLTNVAWRVGDYKQGGVVMRHVAVAGGRTEQVLLTDSDWIGR
jgi:hypothetical protein